MRIKDEQNFYWTESKGRFKSEDGLVRRDMGFWSKFPKRSDEKKDFNIVKTLILLLSMRLSGIKATLDTSSFNVENEKGGKK